MCMYKVFRSSLTYALKKTHFSGKKLSHRAKNCKTMQNYAINKYLMKIHN